MHAIDIGSIQFSPTIRLLDPNGRVFFHNGGVFRAIYKHRVPFVRKLFNDGIVQSLMKDRLLVGTYLTDLELEGFGLVLRHDAIDVNIRPSEWSIITYMEAAKQYLRLAKELNKHNLALIDAHHSNFSLGLDAIPVWHDFGSIVENPGGSFYCGGLVEFMEYYYYPLLYFRKTKSFSLIRRLGLRLSEEDYTRMLLSGYARVLEMFHPSPVQMLRLIGSFPEGLRRLLGSTISHRMNGKPSLGLLAARLFDELLSNIDRIAYEPENTTWSDYSKVSLENLVSYKNPRSETIINLIKEIKPDRVLDLGANQGIFSHLAHQYCPVVIAADYDHAAVAKHAKFLLDSKANTRIYPVMVDAITMSDDIVNRYRSYTVLALALTHHLRLGQSYPFDFIAKQLSSISERFLITEFMPNGLGVGKIHPNPLPDDYTLETFLSSLGKYFSKVTVVDYAKDPSVSPRILIFCSK